MPDGIRADFSEITTELRLVDKKFAAGTRKELRSAVTESGAVILAAVRGEASWSKRIPPATTLAPSFSANRAGVILKTNAKAAPHARPYEFGSKGNPGVLRHPVFGNKKKWVSEPTRPFFFSATEAATPEVEKRMFEAVETVMAAAGFKGR